MTGCVCANECNFWWIQGELIALFQIALGEFISFFSPQIRNWVDQHPSRGLPRHSDWFQWWQFYTRLQQNQVETHWVGGKPLKVLPLPLLLECLGVVHSLTPTWPWNLGTAAQLSIISGLSKHCHEVGVTPRYLWRSSIRGGANLFCGTQCQLLYLQAFFST